MRLFSKTQRFRKNEQLPSVHDIPQEKKVTEDYDE